MSESAEGNLAIVLCSYSCFLSSWLYIYKCQFKVTSVFHDLDELINDKLMIMT